MGEIMRFLIWQAELMVGSGILIREVQKKGQATYIAPLQPPTLATFRSWGSSAGAGRIRLAQTAKVASFSLNTNRKKQPG